jgi:two-component system, LuxR family, sensor kinase FixL
LGQMSSAFAHELTQPLAAAHNYLGVAQRLLQGDAIKADRLQDMVGKADAQFVRASEIIRRIRDFSRKGHATRSPEDIAALINEAVEIALINPNHRNAGLMLDLPPNGLTAVVDKVQIQQVLLNLLRNAFEAMEGRDDRTVRVSAAPAGEGMIELRVEDNGPGLSQEIATRLFQPFVTSKRDGMGVGLSLCREIVESHGGNMWVDAGYDRGAAFCFTVLAEPRT